MTRRKPLQCGDVCVITKPSLDLQPGDIVLVLMLTPKGYWVFVQTREDLAGRWMRPDEIEKIDDET